MNIKSFLTKHNLRITTPRLVIFEILLTAHKPLAVSEILQRTTGQVDRASVYRTLEIFETIGVTRRITIGWKYKIELGEQFLDHHHHFVCLKCQKVTAIDEAQVATFVEKLSSDSGFQPVEHHFEVKGVCGECRGLLT